LRCHRGTSEDCNLNLIPDECEPDQDCNNNQTRDICDIGAGTSDDCNCSWVPDECELAGNDCNENQIPDDCELTQNDCNENDVPDECDIGAGTSWDCDQNGEPDECQAASRVCCLPDGTCVVTLQSCCEQHDGWFRTRYYACDELTAPCPSQQK
jgi:hypothetical protein